MQRPSALGEFPAGGGERGEMCGRNDSRTNVVQIPVALYTGRWFAEKPIPTGLFKANGQIVLSTLAWIGLKSIPFTTCCLAHMPRICELSMSITAYHVDCILPGTPIRLSSHIPKNGKQFNLSLRMLNPNSHTIVPYCSGYIQI